MSGWVQVYMCLCSDSATNLGDLPDRCPGHSTDMTGRSPGRADLPMPTRHECFERTCQADEGTDMSTEDQRKVSP